MGIWKTIAARGAWAADAAMRLGAFDVERKIDAAAEDVWIILIDTHTWPEWGPSVIDVEHDGRFLDADSEGSVRTAAGLWVDFRVTDWEDGRRWVWDVEGVRATGHRVEPLDEGRCRLVFEVPTVAAPYAAVCKRAADKIADIATREPRASGPR
ncbi:MAG: SRPBCC family protein [Myxococcota bacterium]